MKFIDLPHDKKIGSFVRIPKSLIYKSYVKPGVELNDDVGVILNVFVEDDYIRVQVRWLGNDITETYISIWMLFETTEEV